MCTVIKEQFIAPPISTTPLLQAAKLPVGYTFVGHGPGELSLLVARVSSNFEVVDHSTV